MDQSEVQAVVAGLAYPVADTSLAVAILAQLVAAQKGIDGRRLSSQLKRKARMAKAKQRDTLAVLLQTMSDATWRAARRR